MLRQLLDQSVGNIDFVSELNIISQHSQHETVARTEHLLWELLAKECSKASGYVAIVVDGITSGDGTTAIGDELLAKLQELTSNCESVRCLALTDPDAVHAVSGGVQVYTLSHADIRRNARLFLQGAVAASATLSVLSAHIRQEISRHILERQWTSLLEAKLILRLLESEHDIVRMPDIICKTPKTVHGIIDHMILKIDFANAEMQTLLSWLLVSKRPVEVLELEQHGSISVSNWLRRIRSGRPVSSNTSLAGIVTVSSNGHVQFVDSVVKARMHYMSLHGKIPLSLHSAHRRVALDCLKHAREGFSLRQHQKVDLVFQDPVRSKWAVSSSYADMDNLLVYSVRNWYDHYEESLTSSEKLSRHVPSEISSLLPDSILMSLAEWHYLRAKHQHSGLGIALNKILTLRKLVFGASSPSVIQTAINLAHYEKRSGKVSLERLIDAFEGTVTAFGDPSTQATAGAKYIFSFLKEQTVLSSSGYHVCRYLWGVQRRELGDSHDETLLVAQKLADLYRAELRFADASNVLHNMYEACCRSKGLFASRTVELFHLLIDALEHADSMRDAQDLCQDVFDAAPTIEGWTEAVLSAVGRVVLHYQDRGMPEESRSKLHQLWHLLQGQMKKRTAPQQQREILVVFTSVSLQLATKLTDLALEQDGISILKSFWTLAFKHVNVEYHHQPRILVQLREMAQLLFRLDQHQDALAILKVLHEIHQSRSHDHHHSKEMLQVYSVLIACYRVVQSPIENFLWLDILDSILLLGSGEHTSSDTVLLCRDLAVLHRSKGQWKTAISICQKTLTMLWSQVISLGSEDGVRLTLPDDYTNESIQLAIIMAQLYNMTEADKHKSKIMLDAIITCCRERVVKRGDLSQDIARTLLLALEEAEFYIEAHGFSKYLLIDCSGRDGHSRQFALQLAAIIARLSLQLELDLDDDIGGIIEIEPDEDDLDSISLLIESLFALCRSNRRGGQTHGPKILNWYQRLWSYYFDLRHDLAMETSRGFEIFMGYSEMLVSVRNIPMAIRLARKLRATFLSDFSREDIWYLKASIELAKLLEMDDSTVREAVDIYDDIDEICLRLSVADEAFLLILRQAQERLSILVSSKPVLHDRAEDILVKAWRQTYKKHGHSHERSMGGLKKLIAFWASAPTLEHRERAEETLKEAVLNIMLHEKKPQKLFHCAEYFLELYSIMGFSFSDLSFLKSLRAQLSNSSNVKKASGLCGQAYLNEQTEDFTGLYDRRCLILSYSLEAMFKKNESGDALMGTILTRVMSETALYEAWLRASTQRDRLDHLFMSATQLVEHLEIYKLHSEAQEIQDQLLKLFNKSLGRSEGANSNDASIYELFQAILVACQEERMSLSLLEMVFDTVEELSTAEDRQACLLLSQWIYSHAKSCADLPEEDGSSATLTFLKLSTLLYSYSETTELVDLSHSLEELASMVGILAISYTSEIDLSVLKISHLRFILSITGRQKNYKTLKVSVFPF